MNQKRSLLNPSLGTFHTTMNLLGYIGILMEKTGLGDVLEQIYAENAVIHILKGKAYSRALRGNLPVDMALNVVLINTFDDGEIIKNDIQYAENMYNLVLKGKKASPEIESDDRMSSIKRNFEVLKEKVKNIKDQ